jgi:hypothetical protein
MEVGRALFGLDQPEHGEIRLEGHLVALASPRMAMHKGIGFVSSNRQLESLAMNLTVRENFFLNPQNRGWRWGWEHFGLPTGSFKSIPICYDPGTFESARMAVDRRIEPGVCR